MKKINSEITMSVSAIVIAIVSIFISIWVGNIERKHFRLSVKPAIIIEQGFYEDQNPKVKLINHGLGPATIIEAKLYFDGELLSNSNYYQEIHNKLGYSWEIVSTSFTQLTSGKIVGKDEEITILEHIFHKHDDYYYKHRFELISRMSGIIKYKSLYDEEFKVNFEGVFE